MRVIMALCMRNIKLFLRNRLQIVLIVIMPFFYLYLLSTIFKSTDISNPTTYVLTGIIIIVVFQTSLNIATSTIDDIVSGYMKEILVSPIKRTQIVFGQIFSATIIATFQGIIILIVGYFIGLKYTSMWTPVFIILSMIFIGMVFSSFGLFLATSIKNSQTFQIASVAVTTPITFLCGVYVPLSLLPKGLQYAAFLNPMTYAASFFRTLSLEKMSMPLDDLIADQLAFKLNSFVITPQMSFFVVLSFGILFLFLCTLIFVKVDFSKINRTQGNKDIYDQ